MGNLTVGYEEVSPSEVVRRVRRAEPTSANNLNPQVARRRREHPNDAPATPPEHSNGPDVGESRLWMEIANQARTIT